MLRRINIKSRCEKCNSNLHAIDLLNHLIKEEKESTLCAITCQECGHSTQVLDKPYIHKR